MCREDVQVGVLRELGGKFLTADGGSTPACVSVRILLRQASAHSHNISIASSLYNCFALQLLTSSCVPHCCMVGKPLLP